MSQTTALTLINLTRYSVYTAVPSSAVDTSDWGANHPDQNFNLGNYQNPGISAFRATSGRRKTSTR